MALIKTVPSPPSLHRDLCKAVRSPVPVAAALTPFVLPTEAIAILKLETYKFLRGQPCTVKYTTRLNCARSTRNQAHVPRRFGVNRLKLPVQVFRMGQWVVLVHMLWNTTQDSPFCQWYNLCHSC